MREAIPVLKVSMLDAIATDAGRLFHCTTVLGIKLCCRYSLVLLGMMKAMGCGCRENLVISTRSLLRSSATSAWMLLYIRDNLMSTRR